MIIGIDLGTTNSAVGIWQDGEARLVPNALGDLLTPSAVAIGDDGQVLTGLAARERMVTHPHLSRTVFKRLMGTNAKAKLGRHEFGAEDLSAFVLRSLAADVEAFCGERPERAVITVPAYFNDKQRKATRRAGELAGLKVERLVNEPTAAALAYGIHRLGEENPFLVFDLGGGTFDVSIVEIFDGIIEVRSSSGDNRLGGEDFNEAVVALALQKIGGRDWKAIADPRLRAVLGAAAERTRRALTDAPEAPFSFVWLDERFEATITEAGFEEAAAPLIARLREPVVRALRDGQVRAEQLSEVVMIGGATRMPIMRKAATRMFGRFPANRIHPDHAVALGAAVQAGLQMRDSALKEVRMTDVCPFTLGVESSERAAGGGFRDGLFSPIIERNTVIPASREQIFGTMQDGQRYVDFRIFQGESRLTAENVLLGKVRIEVPPKRAGDVLVAVRFSYDSSGLLEVDVEVPETGRKEQVVIVDEEAADEKQLAERRAALALLKVHPRDDEMNMAVKARAGRCYENLLGDERHYVGMLMSRLDQAIESQDPRTIERVRAEVAGELDKIEGESFL
ncbi:MAG TPA: molecular chaperone HscC [Allosphingosinicella sp.]|nr:molecular chaperone HscC [Allosphingosinicella sp.]